MCTRKDIRFVGLSDGKIRRILTGLLRDSEDEISTFSSVNQFKNFILADHRGALALHSYSTGEFIKQLAGH